MADTLGAADFTKLGPDMRCVALVGFFLQYWSGLEATLNQAIEQALDLTMVQGAVVTKNIQLRDKVHILKTLVDLRGNDTDHLKQVLEDVAQMSGERNMIAHDTFLPDHEGDGVEFVVVKAKGKLAFPKTKWSIADIFAKYAKILELTQGAREVTVVLSAITLGKLLREAQEPNAAFGGLGLLNPLLHQLPEPLHSSPPPTNTEKRPETRSKRRRK